jgi:hypothetical protein
MANGETDDVHYEGGDSLRQAAEDRFGRSLTREEWALVDPDGSYARPFLSYSDADLDDLLEAMGQLPPPPRPSTMERQRARALAHRERTAAEAKEFVEKDRIWLFGSPDPPFKDAAADAAAWIEKQAHEPIAFLFTLTVAMPSELYDLAPFLWLRDWLVGSLPDRLPDGEEERKAAFRSFIKGDRSPIRRIGNEGPVLAYIGRTESGQFVLKRIRADEGTVLGNLREASDRLAKATEWDQLAACHHLLTGGVMSAPVGASPLNRFGEESFGGPIVTIKVPDPFGVSADAVAAAFIEARASLWTAEDCPPQRATLSARHERLAALVEETPDAKWADRLALWNQRYPSERFSSSDSMGRAYRRSRR